MISKTGKCACIVLNYIEKLILVSAGTGWVWVSGFGSLIGIPVGTASASVGLRVCVIAAIIKKYKIVIKKEKEKHKKNVIVNKN